MRNRELKWFLCCAILCFILVNQFLISLLAVWISDRSDFFSFDYRDESVINYGMAAAAANMKEPEIIPHAQLPDEQYATRDFEGQVVRPSQCYKKTYTKLPTASVVITTLDEEVPILEETIKSILYYSPPSLLKEIVVVDDFGERIPVPELIATSYPKVKLIRSEKALGVAGARIAGADQAVGDVYVFLDSHMLTTKGWLEPLLEYVKEHPFGVASAVIEALENNATSLRSNGDISIVTLLHHKLDFKWTTYIPRNRITDEPIQSPVLLGSAFAISKYWWKMGKYDPGFQVWGMENIELATRTWTCGDSVVFHPCSHVGHQYRPTRRNPQPRWSTPDFIRRNGVRFAEVWMDEFKQDYYNTLNWSERKLNEARLAPDLEDRHQLRKALACKPFGWYLTNVVKRLENRYNVKPYEEQPTVPTHTQATLDTLNQYIRKLKSSQTTTTQPQRSNNDTKNVNSETR